MFLTRKLGTLLIVLFLFLSACSEYNKVLKSSDLEWKYAKAMEYYENGKYFKAYPLLEELVTYYRGTSKAEDIYYVYAYTDYKLEDYLLASHRFKQFVKTFPRSSKAQECRYMSAYCAYLMSPNYSLDQDPTYDAIDKLQLFINEYPQSKRADTCTRHIEELQEKLEYKFYMGAKQYFKMEDYKAAYTTFENLLKKYPGSKYTEEAYFTIYNAHYQLAMKSVKSKQEDRAEKATKAYVKYVDRYPKGKYVGKAEKMYDDLLELKKSFNIVNN